MVKNNPPFLLPVCLVACLILAGCRTQDIEPKIPEVKIPEPEPVANEAADERILAQWELEFRQQRLIGDLLYDALNALNQDRLLTPIDNNAHGRYQRVLAYEPNNKLALEGLQNIVDRYVELAIDASRQGRFAAAQSLLDRARFVDSNSQNISDAQIGLEVEMNSGDLVFELDLAALREQSEDISTKLSEIAIQAREHKAFVLITAPADEQARWMYAQMREAVEGYRLRANIELGALAIVRLRMPTVKSETTDPKPPEVDSPIENSDVANAGDDLN